MSRSLLERGAGALLVAGLLLVVAIPPTVAAAAGPAPEVVDLRTECKKNPPGIDTDEAAPGYRHILIQPRPGGGFTRVKAHQ